MAANSASASNNTYYIVSCGKVGKCNLKVDNEWSIEQSKNAQLLGGRGEKRKFERDALMHLFQMIRSSIVKDFVKPAIIMIMKFWLPINVLPKTTYLHLPI